jgi:hypothetical protein
MVGLGVQCEVAADGKNRLLRPSTHMDGDCKVPVGVELESATCVRIVKRPRAAGLCK